MRSVMFGFYPLSTEEYDKLWQEAIIVLDANVLLDLYRIPEHARDELFSLMEKIQDRLWIPHQVALEFQRNRTSVITEAKQQIQTSLTKSQDLFANFKRILLDIELEKRNVEIDLSPLLDDMTSIQEKIKVAVEGVHQKQLEISSDDPIRGRIDKILEHRVGAGPTNQAELNELVKDGDERFRNKIPPGFADAGKAKGNSDDFFYHNGLQYDRRFGDLIVWRQMISHVKSLANKKVILVTRDKKEDWWWKEHGRALGPHSELLFEFRKAIPEGLMWLYSSSNFLDHAKDKLKLDISDQSMTEVRNAIRTAAVEEPTNRLSFLSNASENRSVIPSKFGLSRQYARYLSIEQAVSDWLIAIGHEIEVMRNEYADFVLKVGSSRIAVDVKAIANINVVQSKNWLRRIIKQGEEAFLAGSIDVFYVIMVIDGPDLVLRDIISTQFGLISALDGVTNFEFIFGSMEGNIFVELFRLPEKAVPQIYKP